MGDARAMHTDDERDIHKGDARAAHTRDERGADTGAARPIRVAQTCEQDAERAVDELYAGIGRPDASLVIFFCSSSFDRDAVAAAISTRFAGRPVVGCTTAGEIGPAGYSDHSITAVSFAAGVCTATTGHLDDLQRFETRDGTALAQDLRRRLQEAAPLADEQNTFAFLLVDGLFGHEEQVAHSIQQGLGRIPLVGGSAGDGLRLERTFVYRDGRFHTDAAILVLASTKLPFRAFKTHHFVPTNDRMVVTEADPAHRVVTEINGLPAAEEYARILGVRVDELDRVHFATRPVVVLVDGANYVRSIKRANPDRSLTFYCAMDRGVVLRVATGVDLLTNLEAAIAQVRAQIGPPQLVLACECAFRKLEVEEKGLSESAREIIRRNNAVGFNGYGEQFCGIHMNQTLTAIAFGAGPTGGVGDAAMAGGDSGAADG